MEPYCNLIFVGSSKSGKTTFIEEFNEIDIVSGVPFSTGDENSIPIHFGRITIQDDYLVVRFIEVAWMQLIQHRDTELKSGVIAFTCVVIFLDCTSPDSLEETIQILSKIRDYPMPYVIVANKQDNANAKNIDEIRASLHLTSEDILLPCVATDRQSVRLTLHSILISCLDAKFDATLNEYFQ
jgi:uncharacterized protein